MSLLDSYDIEERYLILNSQDQLTGVYKEKMYDVCEAYKGSVADLCEYANYNVELLNELPKGAEVER